MDDPFRAADTRRLGDTMHFRTRLFAAVTAMSALTLSGCAVEMDPETQKPPGASEPEAEPSAPKDDVFTNKVIRVKQSIGFVRETIKTDSMDRGVTDLQQAGRAGVRVRVLRLTLKNGVEVDRELVKTFVAEQPVNRVKLVGTRVKPRPKPEPASSCDPNYTGACVPIASDVDCGGGSGDGPEYVYVPVTVTGSDVYDLDNDGDGIACDS